MTLYYYHYIIPKPMPKPMWWYF